MERDSRRERGKRRVAHGGVIVGRSGYARAIYASRERVTMTTTRDGVGPASMTGATVGTRARTSVRTTGCSGPYDGWHYGEHCGPHSGRHDDWHQGTHHEWYDGDSDELVLPHRG